jgi:glycosyltransferase involved in cell wall biosynthesis
MRVLLVQRSLRPPGGGNAVAAWMVHALAGRHEVATLTASGWSAAETNAFYGTSIPSAGVAMHVVPRPWVWLSALPEDTATRLRMCTVLRQARSMADQFDLLVTADNYGAFARPGIQYVHFPADLEPQPARLAPLVHVYFAFCDRVSGVPWAAAARNLTLANSRWTAERLDPVVSPAGAHVLYPPVIDPGPGESWEGRRDTFLCIGRFHETKRIEVAMSIVRRLRAQAMPDATLLIVGSTVDRAYAKRLRQSAARDGDWIGFREDLPRDELNRVMGQCRYGIQAMVGEHFGMATAEMTRAGCIVFPHASGGSIEVVGGDRRLLWQTEDDAVARIGAVARDRVAQDDIRRQLRPHAAQFSPEHFVEALRQLAEAFVLQ